MKGVKSPRKKKFVFWANFARIRTLYNNDQEVIQQGPEGYTTRIRSFYNRDQEVIHQGSGGFFFRCNDRASPENFCL